MRNLRVLVAPPSDNAVMALSGDNPIKLGADDRLQRLKGAQSLAEDIRDVDASEGYVVGIVGPWGSGKTSIVNMVREALQAEPPVPVIDFNPWLFSGTDELVDAFFRELSAQLKLRAGRLSQIAEAIDDYSALLSPVEAIPVLGAWFARFRGAASVINELQQKRKGSVSAQRDKLAKKLGELEAPIVIVIDDIDRLESREIRDIFKLVRLTASFPNLIYVLAFDRERVEEALSQSGFDGRSYLEKIVQLGISVPAVPDPVLLRQLVEALDAGLNDLDVRFNQDAWPDVLMEVVRPLVGTMRDVKRYAAAVRSKVRVLGGQVELVDVFALEAIRIFLPDVFQALISAREGLTTPSGWDSRYESPHLKQQVDQLVETSGSRSELVRSLIRRVFPAAQRHIENNSYGSDWMKTWLKNRRVAHPDVLAAYLELVANEALVAFGLAEQAYRVLDDEAVLAELLRSYDLDALQDVIAALEAFEGEYPLGAVVPAARVLLNLLPSLPERPQGMLSFGGTRLVVTRVVLRLLRQLESPEAVLQAVESILAAVPSLSSRLELVSMVGHREGTGHKLVTEAAAADLERDLLAELEAATPDSLVQEKNLLHLLLTPKFFVDGRVVQVDASATALAAAVLLDGRSVVRSQSVGSRAVHRTTRLHWDVLVDIFGGEDGVKKAIEGLRGTEDPELQEVISLADRYLTGWRPPEWGD